MNGLFVWFRPLLGLLAGLFVTGLVWRICEDAAENRRRLEAELSRYARSTLSQSGTNRADGCSSVDRRDASVTNATLHSGPDCPKKDGGLR